MYAFLNSYNLFLFVICMLIFIYVTITDKHNLTKLKTHKQLYFSQFIEDIGSLARFHPWPRRGQWMPLHLVIIGRAGWNKVFLSPAIKPNQMLCHNLKRSLLSRQPKNIYKTGMDVRIFKSYKKLQETFGGEFTIQGLTYFLHPKLMITQC